MGAFQHWVEGRGVVTFEGRFYRYLVKLDMNGAWDFLGSLQGDELRGAKAWFQRRQTDLIHKAWYDARSELSKSEEISRVSADWVFSLGPIRLLAPRPAARNVRWRNLWAHQETGRSIHKVQLNL
jgi:hypothetical protein